MDRKTTLQRYPFMAATIAVQPKEWLPDYAGPSAADRAAYLSRLTGALARAGLAIIFAAAALALMIYLMVKLI